MTRDKSTIFISLSDFNSHAHVERDLFPLLPRCLSFHFNSHAHVERDWRLLRLNCKNLHFNSHAHVERDYTTGAGTAIVFNFNSHAHVERDVTKAPFSYHFQISTHTLTWSVTCFLCFLGVFHFISTHTLTWSVTGVYSD